jgi:hypothetical protein
MRKILLSAAVCFLINTAVFSQVKILFDATKAESAANADWVIDADVHNMGWGSTGGYTCTCSSNESNAQRLPTPTQTAVTSSTPETYWTGAISHWAIDCVNKGYWVETLPFGTALTYGIGSNPQDLSNYNIFIATEPNVLYTAAEKTAMMNFVQNGGSLLMISDHDNSDRNGDGSDSPVIWNDFITNNGVSNNSCGFKFSRENFSGTHSNIISSPTDSLLHGPYGNVTMVQWSGGTSLNVIPAQNPTAKAVVFRNGIVQASDTAALVVYARVGCGKVAAIGDSSPSDDGTGDPNDNSLYNGYITDAAGNHQKLLMNIVMWMAHPDCTSGIESQSENNSFVIYPNPACNNATIVCTCNSPNKSALQIFTIGGQMVDVPQQYNKDGVTEKFILNTGSLPAGVYYCKLAIDNKIVTRKLIVNKP